MMLDSESSKDKSTEATKEMSLSNSKSIIQFKIVYWGPGESGKTTNFMRLREKFSSIRLTRGYSVETTDGRTLWQDSLFFSFKFSIKESEYSVITQVVTCTGQERFLSTREYVLDGADGIVFVGDSDPEKREQNKRSFRELISFASPNRIPYVVQLNKRDLKSAIPIKEFKKLLGLPLEEKYQDGSLVVYPAIALQNKNVGTCFQDIMLQVIYNYFSS
ncbi:MAG: ADP-ribosylation factor-like protein [Promethearchaeota archaeon]